MRTTWVAVITVLLGLGAGALAAGPEVLPNLPLPAAGPNTGEGPLMLPDTAGPTVGSLPAAPPEVVGEGGGPLEHSMPCHCCGPDAGSGCWHQLCAWFTYRPCLSTLHHLRVPYNPEPPLYLYFLYPPVVEGHGHAFPCCTPRHLLPEALRPGHAPIVQPEEPEVVVEH